MKISLATENKGFIRKTDITISETYNVHNIIVEMMSIHTAKDFLAFVLHVPYSFVSTFAFPFNQREDLRDVLPYEEKHCFTGKIEEELQKGYHEVDYLDELLLNEGILGPIVTRKIIREDGSELLIKEVEGNGRYEFIFFSSIEMLIRNTQALLRFAAIALQDKNNSAIERKNIGEAEAQIVMSGLEVDSDINSDHIREAPLPSLFEDKELARISKYVERRGYWIDNGVLKGDGSYLDQPFLVRETMSDSEVAAYIFGWFINSLFEGNAMSYYSGNTFKVKFKDGRFKVFEPPSPLRELYHEIARIAESGNVKLCSHCGRAFIDEKSRGNKALYCSRSCNTKASNRRRDLAQQYKAAGIPIEKAIAKIGSKYESSIRAWYNESNNRTA